MADWIDLAPSKSVQQKDSSGWQDIEPEAPKTSNIPKEDYSNWGTAKRVSKALLSPEALTAVGRGTGLLASVPVAFPASGAIGLVEGVGKTLGRVPAALVEGEGWEGVKEAIGSSFEEAGQTVDNIASLPAQAYLGAPKPKGQSFDVMSFAPKPKFGPEGEYIESPEVQAANIVGYPFEKLHDLNKAISGTDEEGAPNAWRYAAGAIPEMLAYTAGGALLAKKGMKAITAKPMAELLAKRTAAAEKAGIPQAAPQANAKAQAGVLDALAPTVGSKVAERRRRRNVEADLEKIKQEDAIKLSNLTKSPEEIKSSLIIEEEPTGKIDEGVVQFVDNQVKALGSVEKVREVYKTDSPVDIYAREKAQEIFPTTEAVPVETAVEKTPVDNVPPSVRKPNKGKLTPEELEDLKQYFSEEELQALAKMPVMKQREKYNRYAGINVIKAPTPEEIAKAEALFEQVDKSGKRLKYEREQPTQKKPAIEKNPAAKAYQDYINETRGKELTPEQEELGDKLYEDMVKELESELTKDEIGKADKFNIAVDEEGNVGVKFSKEAERKFEIAQKGKELMEKKGGLSSRNRANLAATEKARMKMLKALEDEALKNRRRLPRNMEEVEEVEHIPNEDLSAVDYTQPIRTRADEIRAERKRVSGKDNEWEELLADEGMPAELEFNKNPFQNSIKDKFPTTLVQKFKDLNELLSYHTEVLKESAIHEKIIRDIVSQIDNGTFRLHSNVEARNLRAHLDQILPRDAKSAAEWLDMAYKIERVAAPFIIPKRLAFSRKAINEAVKNKAITKDEAKYINAVFNALKEQPTFEFKISPEMDAQNGIYSFVRNLIDIKNPQALAHEVGHFAWHNVLSTEDRMLYRKAFVERYYSPEGRIKRTKLFLDTTNAYNAARSPGEMFACKFSDYAHEKVLSPAEMNLFTKIRNWWSGLKKDLMRIGGLEKFEEADRLIAKVIDPARRTPWNEDGTVTTRDSYATPGYTSPLTEALNAGQKKSDLTRVSDIVVKRTMTIPEAADYDMQSMFDRAYEIGKMFKKAKKNSKGKVILDEIQGNDWGLSSKYGGATILDLTPNEGFFKRLYKGVGPYIVSPMNFAKGTILEPYVYRANLAEMFIGFKYDQHRTFLDNALIDLKKAGGNPENIRKIIEGRIEGIPAEIETAGKVREWLDVMKEKYKLRQIEDYKANLNKTEYKALLDYISGKSVDEVKARYPKLDTKTIEDIYNKHKEIDTWGIDDYITNFERGHYKIMTNVTGKDGKATRIIIGYAMSKKDAVRKAVKYAEDNPSASELFIDTKPISFDEKTTITGKQYYGIMNKLAKQIKEDMEEINGGIAKEMARKSMNRQFNVKPTEVFSAFLKDRHDIVEGEPDIFPVLKNYAYTMEKKMALDPVIDGIKKELHKMDAREKAYILDFIEDVKGRYGAMDKFIDGITGTFHGYSRFVTGARTAEANLKLGYRPIAASINLMSGQLHVYVKHGAKTYAEALSFLKSPEGLEFTRQVEPFLGTNIVEYSTGITSKTPVYKPLGLFQKAEPYNRQVSAAAAYLQGLREGMTPEAARTFAIRANWAEQFTYNMANLPKIMRGPTGKLITQFKPYLFKELEFIGSLSGREWARYAAMQLALGGPKGYMLILKSLPILSTMYWWDDLEELMNKKIPALSRGIGGVPSVFGLPDYSFDMSAAATFQIPDDVWQIAGPFLSDLFRIKKNVYDPIKGIYSKAKDGVYPSAEINQLGSIAPILRHWNRLMEFTFSKDDMLRKEDGNELYKVESPSALVLQSILGVEPIDVNRVKAEDRILVNRNKRLGEQKRELLDVIAAYNNAGKEIPEELITKLVELGGTGETIRRRFKSNALSPEIRATLGTEALRRPDVLEMFPVPSDQPHESMIRYFKDLNDTENLEVPEQ
jgi:hypothetical protein